MKQFTNLVLSALLLFAGSTTAPKHLTAQEPSSESLRLPEVVITGTDQSRIQRVLPKVALPSSSLLLIQESSRDASTLLIEEADLITLIQPEKAIPLYQQAIALAPTDSRAYHRLGDAYRTSSQYDAAVKAYQQALEIVSSLVEAHYQLGILYESRLNDPPKAIEHYQQYIKRGGTDSRVRTWLRNLEQRELQAAPQEIPSS